MLNRFIRNEASNRIQKLIDKLEERMDEMDVTSDEFSETMEQLERLYEIKKDHRPDHIRLDTLAMVAGNLAGILLIVAYEHKHVMNSKGFTQLFRPTRPTT